MKKIAYFFAASLLTACSSNYVDLPIEPIESKQFMLNENEAVSIANEFFGLTRNSAEYSVTYLNAHKSENYQLPIAYILNNVDGNGWIIIACDKRVKHILAYSDDGQFVYDSTEENVIDSFYLPHWQELIDKDIKDYENGISTNSLINPPISRRVNIEPKLSKGFWKQDAPFNQYITTKEGAPYLVGCTPLAMGMIFANCKNQITYETTIDGVRYIENFNFREIRQGLADSIVRVAPPIIFPYQTNSTDFDYIMTYDQAIDKVSKLLWFIGRDMNVDYGISVTGTSWDSFPPTLFREYGYMPRNETIAVISQTKIVEKLSQGHIIYAESEFILGGEVYAHSWVIDGCSYTYSESMVPNISNIYLHCDWGWGGRQNGYYRTESTFDGIEHFNGFSPVLRGIAILQDIY